MWWNKLYFSQPPARSRAERRGHGHGHGHAHDPATESPLTKPCVVAELLKARRDAPRVPGGAELGGVARHEFLEEALNSQLEETIKRYRSTNVAFKKDYLNSFPRDDPHLLDLATHHNKVARARAAAAARRTASAPTLALSASARLLTILQQAGPALDGPGFEEREKKRQKELKLRQKVEHAVAEEKGYPTLVPTWIIFEFFDFVNKLVGSQRSPIMAFFARLDFYENDSVSMNEWMTALKLLGLGSTVHPDQQVLVFRALQTDGVITAAAFKQLEALFELQRLAMSVGVAKAREMIRVQRQKANNEFVPDKPVLSVKEQTKQLALGGFGGRLAMSRASTMRMDGEKDLFTKIVKKPGAQHEAVASDEAGSPSP